MDRDNLRGIRRLAGDASGETQRARLHLLSEFLPDGSVADVPDPYYGGEDGFETVLDMIETACPNILDILLERA